MAGASELTEMQPNDIDAVVELIQSAMNPDEASWARQTFEFHFRCMENQINSMRQFFILQNVEHLIGIVGLHQYRWGPPINSWLSWFAVHPDFQGQGHGKALLCKAEQAAAEAGYTKLFIETYEHPDFHRAIDFYQRQGFITSGEISQYLADGSKMLVLSKDLS